MVCVYCGILSPPILISEVLPPAQVVYMVIVEVFTKGGGLIITSDVMMNVSCRGWCRGRRWQLSWFDGSDEHAHIQLPWPRHPWLSRQNGRSFGLVESINHLPGVCTTIYPCSTSILIDRIIIENCKKIVVSEENCVGDLLSGRHWPIATRQC